MLVTVGGYGCILNNYTYKWTNFAPISYQDSDKNHNWYVNMLSHVAVLFYLSLEQMSGLVTTSIDLSMQIKLSSIEKQATGWYRLWLHETRWGYWVAIILFTHGTYYHPENACRSEHSGYFCQKLKLTWMSYLRGESPSLIALVLY